MSLITVDEQKCKRDGACVSECPAGILEMKTPQSFPTPVSGADLRCIRCGHCVAVCSTGALSHHFMHSGDCAPYQKDLVLSPQHVEHVLRSRRSIRSYKSTPLARQDMERLLDVVRYAPTGSNSQRVGWLVVQTRAEVERLTGHAVDWMRDMVRKGHPMAEGYNMKGIVNAWDHGIDIISRGAPALVFAYGPEVYTVAQIDCTIALSYLDVAAPSFGLGTCWAGFIMIALQSWEPLARQLHIPEGHKAIGAMMIGYPRFRYHRLPTRNEAVITWQG